jgi:hypothetical protein
MLMVWFLNYLRVNIGVYLEVIVLLDDDIVPIIPIIFYDFLQLLLQHSIISFGIHSLRYFSEVDNSIGCHAILNRDRSATTLDYGLDK